MDVTENNYLIDCDIFFFESQAAIKVSKYIRASEKKNRWKRTTHFKLVFRKTGV